MKPEFLFHRSTRAYQVSLFDPEKNAPTKAASIAANLEKEGSDAILVGGSDSLHSSLISKTVKAIKREVSLPVMQIIRDSSEISEYADGIIVPLVLNSYEVSYSIGIALNSLHILKDLGIPGFPIGYVLVGMPSTASFVTRSIPIPLNKAKIIKQLAIGAEGIGLRALYLEGGSGSLRPVPKEFITIAKQNTSFPIIVGGGIRTAKDARLAIDAGADVIVVGTVIEEKGSARGIIYETKRKMRNSTSKF